MTEMTEVPKEPPVLENAVLEQIAEVANEESEEPLTRNQAARLIAAYHHVVSGDPIGTMRRDPETGAIALKTMGEGGMMIWRVNVPDGTQYNDLQPTLPWPKID